MTPAKNSKKANEGSEALPVEVPVEAAAESEEIQELGAKLAEFEEKEKKESAEEITFPNGAIYKQVGKCQTCGTPVYDCITNMPGAIGVSFDEGMGNRLAVQVPGAWVPPIKLKDGKEMDKVIQPLTLYCKMHDPNKHLIFYGKKRNPDEPINASDWELQR